MAVEKTFGYGNGSPYRSATFNKNNELIFGGNGPLSIDKLYVDGTDIILENITFVQEGIIVSQIGRLEIPFPNVPAPFYLAASVPDSRPTDNISWTFVRRPQDIGDNLALLAEWDGQEFRPLSERTIQALLDSRVKSAVAYDNIGFNKGFKFSPSPDFLTYTVTPGILTDTSGNLIYKEKPVIFDAILEDSDWPRFDSILFRRNMDDPDRIGMFILRAGATYAGTSFVRNPELEAGNSADVKSFPKILILEDNTHVIMHLRQYGENGEVVATKYDEDRTTVLIADTILASNVQSFDVVVDPASGGFMVALESNGNIQRAKYDASFAEVLAPVDIENLSNPSSKPKIQRDYLGNYYIVFLYQAGPSTFTPYLIKLNNGGSISKSASILVNNTAKYSKIDFIVTEDLDMRAVFTNESTNKIEYVQFDEIGIVTASKVILSDLVDYEGTDLIEANARNGRIYQTENGKVFFTWETEKQVDQWGLTLFDYSKEKPVIISITNSLENVDNHVLDIDWQNHGYFLLSVGNKAIFKKINLETLVSRQINYETLLDPAGILLDIKYDKKGSLVMFYGGESAGYSSTGVDIQDYFTGPDSYGAEHAYITNEEIAVKNSDIAGLPKNPTVGDRLEIQGSGNSGMFDIYSKRSVVIDSVAYTVFRSVGEDFTAEDGSSDPSYKVLFYTKSAFSTYQVKQSAATDYTYSTVIEDTLSTDLLLTTIRPELHDSNSWYDQYRVKLTDPATRGESLIACDGDISWDLASSTMDWATDFKVIEPFRNKFKIPAGSITDFAEGEILYVFYPKSSEFTEDGDTEAPNTITLGNVSDFFAGQEVFIGDTDSQGMTANVVAVNATSIELDVSASAYTMLRGAYVIPVTIAFKKEEKNKGDLKPNKDGEVCSRVYTIATREEDKIIFREGSLTLEDGESGNLGDGSSSQILSYIGAANDADSDPDYTNALGMPIVNSTVVDGESLTKSVKRLDMRPDIVEAKAINVMFHALPSAFPVEVDGITINIGDLVLQGNVAVAGQTDGIYELTDNGGSPEWIKKVLFKGSTDPYNGSLVNIIDGATNYYKTIWDRHEGYWRPTKLDDAVKDPSGFTKNLDTNITVYTATNQFAIGPAQGSYFDFFINGRPYRQAGENAVVLPNTYGTYYLYFTGNDNGIMTYTTDWDTANANGHLTIAAVFHDGDEFAFIGDLRHGINMDDDTREYLHSSFGLQLTNGLDIGNFILDGDGSQDSHAQVSISDGIAKRQDILLPIHDGTLAEQFGQPLAGTAEIPVMYRLGASGSSKKDLATTFPVKSGSNTITYNKYDTSWSATDVPDGHFVTYFAFTTNNVVEPIVSIMGQKEHATLSEAQEQDQFNSLAFSDFPKRDFKILYRMIFQADSTYTNSIKARLVYIDDVRSTSESGNFEVIAPNDHGLLTGLNDPDHQPTAVTTVGIIKDGGLSESDVDVKSALQTLNELLGQFRIKEHPTNKKRVILTGADRILNDGTTLSQVVKNLLLSFEGAEIDFSLGKVYKVDGITDLGLDFIPAAIPSNEWHWYTVAVVPSTVNSDLTIDGQVLVIPAATSGATKDLAEKAPFTNNTNIGMVAVQEFSSTIADITQGDIRQLGVGSGSGSGGGIGDLTYIEDELRSNLRYSPYRWVTPFDYRKIGEDYTDNGTASYSIVNSVYEFSVGQFIETVNVLDDAYKKTDDDTRNIEIHTFQGEEVDDLFSVSATANGSAPTPIWYPVSMDRVGTSRHWAGRLDLPVENTMDSVVDLVPTSGSLLTLDNVNRKMMAMPFYLDDKAGINRVEVPLTKVGSPLGLIVCRVVGDDGTGSPDVTKTLAASNGALCTDITGTQTVVFDFARFSLGQEQTYYLLLETDSIYKSTSDGSNNIGVNFGPKPASYTAGILQFFDGSSWADSSNSCLEMHFLGNFLDVRIKYTAGTEDATLNGIGVLYGDSYDLVHGGDLRNTQTFLVDGDLDETSFTLGNFRPDAKILKVYDSSTGQVYAREKLVVDGFTVSFPTGTFEVPGEKFYLHFDQYEGNGFDNSDLNRTTIQSNHLGSTDPISDFSVPGRGIILRRPDGTLREIRINDDDNLEVLEV